MASNSLKSQDVKNIRKRYKLSQRDLAGLIGVSHALVARWETGTLRVGEGHSRSLESLTRVPDSRMESEEWRAKLSEGRCAEAFFFLCFGSANGDLDQ